ncbi:hypothetical protein HKD37_12G034628 [Glycine soja]
MTDRGRGGGRRIFNRGRRRSLSLGAPITTNPSTSSIHISTSEDASPSAPDDSLTPEYPPDPNCEHIVDQRPFIRAYKGEFQPTYGCSNIISNIIRAKFDEPAASWLTVSVDLRDRLFGEFKFLFPILFRNSIGGIHKKSEPLELFLRQKSSIAKVNRSVDRGASTYCGGSISTVAHFEKLEKYQHRRNEILQHSTEEDTSTQDFPNTATSINDDEIYLNVVGGPNYKGNVYGLGTLSKRFSCSKSTPSTFIALVEDQIEEMRETINKLNAELLAKANKEKTLEEKILQLMENHDHQSQEMRQQMQEQNEQIRQQNEQMQRILQHLHIQSIMPTPSLSATIADGTEHHVNDAQVDRPHDMGNDR